MKCTQAGEICDAREAGKKAKRGGEANRLVDLLDRRLVGTGARSGAARHTTSRHTSRRATSGSVHLLHDRCEREQGKRKSASEKRYSAFRGVLEDTVRLTVRDTLEFLLLLRVLVLGSLSRAIEPRDGLGNGLVEGLLVGSLDLVLEVTLDRVAERVGYMI